MSVFSLLRDTVPDRDNCRPAQEELKECRKSGSALFPFSAILISSSCISSWRVIKSIDGGKMSLRGVLREIDQ